MVDRPRSDLVNRALRILGAAPVGQTPEQDDYDVVDGLVEPLLERLSAESITTIDNPDAIPGAQFLDVAILLADIAKVDFGLASLPFDPTQSEVRLRTVVSTGPTMEEVEVTDPDTGAVTTEERIETLDPEWM